MLEPCAFFPKKTRTAMVDKGISIGGPLVYSYDCPQSRRLRFRGRLIPSIFFTPLTRPVHLRLRVLIPVNQGSDQHTKSTYSFISSWRGLLTNRIPESRASYCICVNKHITPLIFPSWIFYPPRYYRKALLDFPSCHSHYRTRIDSAAITPVRAILRAEVKIALV